MMELRKRAMPAVEKLLQGDESELYEQLGLRARAIELDPSTAGNFDPTVVYEGTIMGPLDDVRELGRRIFRRWNIEVYKLICGSSNIDEKDRKDLLAAFFSGEAAVAASLAVLLVASLQISPAIATVIAALVVRRFFRPAYEEFCEFWKEKLPQSDGG